MNTKLYFATVNCMYPVMNEYWDGLFDRLGPQGQLWINMARYLGKNRFISRRGLWTSPWKTAVVPGFEMPVYEPGFSLDFAEITNQRALDIKNLIHRTDSRVAVYYSGGIDSTLCLVALLKNLTSEELQHIDVCMSAESLIENPYFYEKHILKTFNVVDSSVLRYSDVEKSGHYAITCDQGDSIFGTELGTQMYATYSQLLNKVSQASRQKLENLRTKISDAETHFSAYTDLIIAYFELENQPQFGAQFYEKLTANINSAEVPIRSLHDFFWWYIFNIKYMECALRGSIYYYAGQNHRRSVNETIINWFNHPNYQKWSMCNNNNAQKILGPNPATYKWAAKQYIYEFDKNEWYLRYKTKLSSLKNIFSRNSALLNEPQVFAMDENYDLLYFDDQKVKVFIEESLLQFK